MKNRFAKSTWQQIRRRGRDVSSVTWAVFYTLDVAMTTGIQWATAMDKSFWQFWPWIRHHQQPRHHPRPSGGSNTKTGRPCVVRGGRVGLVEPKTFTRPRSGLAPETITAMGNDGNHRHDDQDCHRRGSKDGMGPAGYSRRNPFPAHAENIRARAFTDAIGTQTMMP